MSSFHDEDTDSNQEGSDGYEQEQPRNPYYEAAQHVLGQLVQDEQITGQEMEEVMGLIVENKKPPEAIGKVKIFGPIAAEAKKNYSRDTKRRSRGQKKRQQKHWLHKSTRRG